MDSTNKRGSRKDKNGRAQSSIGSNLMWPFIALIGIFIAIAIGIRSGGLLTTNQCDDTTDCQWKLMEITSKYNKLQEWHSELKKEYDDYKTQHKMEAQLECESPQTVAREFETTIVHLEDELSKCSSTRDKMEIKLATCEEQSKKYSEASSDVKNKQKVQDTKEKQDCRRRIQELNAEKSALKAEHKILQIEVEKLKTETEKDRKETEKDRKEAEKAQKKGERFQQQLEELIMDRDNKQTEISKMKTKLRKCERDLDKMAKDEKNRDKKKNGK